jgi:ribonuclease-3
MGQLPDGALERLQVRLGYRFRDPLLLKQALTHKSHQVEGADERPRSNERLEFLGDAVLGVVVAAHLCNEHSDWSEGDLTKVKAVAVSEAILTQVGQELGLGEFLLMGKGEELSGGRDRPSLLANAVEALIGAMFLDVSERTFDRYPVGRVVLGLLQPALEEIERTERGHDYKTLLQEWSQEHHHLLPSYEVVDEAGPDHSKTFVVEVRLNDGIMGTGQGRTKKEAEQNAARQALEHADSSAPGRPGDS